MLKHRPEDVKGPHGGQASAGRCARCSITCRLSAPHNLSMAQSLWKFGFCSSCYCVNQSQNLPRWPRYFAVITPVILCALKFGDHGRNRAWGQTGFWDLTPFYPKSATLCPFSVWRAVWDSLEAGGPFTLGRLLGQRYPPLLLSPSHLSHLARGCLHGFPGQLRVALFIESCVAHLAALNVRASCFPPTWYTSSMAHTCLTFLTLC